jgi:regulator of cell morphogenesis and NO signaling
MTNIAQQTLATIVMQHHKAVPILEKYHLDFCCKGKRTLTDACMEKGLPLATVLKELEQFTSPEEKAVTPAGSMSAEQLISHILLRHHFYVKQAMPAIYGHLEKVASKHGERFPNMVKVLRLFSAVKEEMTSHMEKEEMILFPRIKEVEKLFTDGQKTNLAAGYINGPVHVMEMEHEQAGQMLDDIRILTNNYTPPQDACTTFRVSLNELKEFEEDLHRHVHLENYLLFPMAEKMLNKITEA